MVEIHRDEQFAGVFLGGIGAARNFAGLNQHGIKSVLDVAAEDPRQQAGLELPAVAEHGTAARALSANSAVCRVEEVIDKRCALVFYFGQIFKSKYSCFRFALRVRKAPVCGLPLVASNCHPKNVASWMMY